MSRVVSIFPCCCLVCFCLLPRAALHDSCPSYSCLCASLVYIVFGICLADDPFGRCGIIARQRFILICFGRSLHPTHEAGLLPSPRLAGCPLQMHRGQPALGRHRPVSILVETSGCCCRGSRLICQRVSLSPPGWSPGGARRVRCVGWHSSPD